MTFYWKFFLWFSFFYAIIFRIDDHFFIGRKLSSKFSNYLKRACDRNFPRDQLFCDLEKLRCNESYFSGMLLLFVYLYCWENLIKLKAQKQCRFWEAVKAFGTKERIREIKTSWLGLIAYKSTSFLSIKC